MLLLLFVDFIFLQKFSPLKCRFVPTFGPEILSKCFRCPVWFIYILKVDFNMYLSKHSWNTHSGSPNTHQYGSYQVCHISYHALWALQSSVKGVKIFVLAASTRSEFLAEYLADAGVNTLSHYGHWCVKIWFSAVLLMAIAAASSKFFKII